MALQSMGEIPCAALFRRALHPFRSSAMIATLGDCPPPSFAAALEKCAIGDWEPTSMVFEWWGRRGIQWYQPLRDGDGRGDPFNEADFDMARPIWRFERCPHPDRMSQAQGRPLSVWRRIS